MYLQKINRLYLQYTYYNTTIQKPDSNFCLQVPLGSYLVRRMFHSPGLLVLKKLNTLLEFLLCTSVHLEQSLDKASGKISTRQKQEATIKKPVTISSISSQLTFQFTTFWCASSFVHQALDVVVQDTFVRQNTVNIDIVVFGGVTGLLGRDDSKNTGNSQQRQGELHRETETEAEIKNTVIMEILKTSFGFVPVYLWFLLSIFIGIFCITSRKNWKIETT